MSGKAFADFWAAVEQGREYSLLVTGDSMRPFLLHGLSIVYMMKESQYDLKRGDIILFQREDGAFALHRVFRVYSDGRLCMNGDAQIWTECIDPTQVWAKVVRVRRKMREVPVTNWFYRRRVFIWMALWPCRSFLFRWRARMFRILKRVREKGD